MAEEIVIPADIPQPSRILVIPGRLFPGTLRRRATALHEVGIGEVVAVRTEDP